MCVCVHVCVCVTVCVSLCVCVCVCVYVCMHACTCVCATACVCACVRVWGGGGLGEGHVVVSWFAYEKVVHLNTSVWDTKGTTN